MWTFYIYHLNCFDQRMMKGFDCHLAVLFCCKRLLAKFGFDGEQWLGDWVHLILPRLFRGMVEFKHLRRVRGAFPYMFTNALDLICSCKFIFTAMVEWLSSDPWAGYENPCGGTVSDWSLWFVPWVFRGMVEFRPFERVQESLWRTVSLNVEDWF